MFTDPRVIETTGCSLSEVSGSTLSLLGEGNHGTYSGQKSEKF